MLQATPAASACRSLHWHLHLVLVARYPEGLHSPEISMQEESGNMTCHACAVAPQQGPAGKKVWGVCFGNLPWRVTRCLGAPVPRRLHAALVSTCSPISPISFTYAARHAPWLACALTMTGPPTLVILCPACLDGQSDRKEGHLEANVLRCTNHAGCPAMPTCPGLWGARDQARCMSCTCSTCCLSPNGGC